MQPSQIRALVESGQPLSNQDISQLMQSIAQHKAQLKAAQDQLGDWEATLAAQYSYDEYPLEVGQAVSYPFGTFKVEAGKDFIYYDADKGGHKAYLEYLLEQVTSEDRPIEEIFAPMGKSLNKTAFKHINDTELPPGVNRDTHPNKLTFKPTK